MRYPNTRYGNPTEMQFYTQGIPIKELSKRLKRSEKSIRAWLNGDRKIPWWIPELLRLQQMEHTAIMRQMSFKQPGTKLGLVGSTGKIIPMALKPRTSETDSSSPNIVQYLNNHSA